MLAAVLIGAAVIPGHAAGSASPPCQGHGCRVGSGTVRWIRRLPGSWTADNGPDGTMLSHGEAFAAVGGSLAAIGLGTFVAGFGATSGVPVWTARLTGFPAGSAIVSVRSWPGVVTVGVAEPGGSKGASREEVVLAAGSGTVLREYPAAMYGGAVAASASRVVIVGDSAVTCYDNATGRVVWSRRTGPVAQAWRMDAGVLYVTEAAGGFLGTAPVTRLRRISLRSGAERLIRPGPHADFAGSLSGAADGVVLFSGSRDLSAYSGTDGHLLWRRPGVVPETEDPVRHTLYVTTGSAMIGLSPLTGTPVKRGAVRGPSGLYGVRNGVALGLDAGARGVAWGYDIARQRVVWTTPALPWPHYFVDLSGIGGSSDPATGTVLLASCAATGTPAPGSTGQQPCTRPELVAIRG